MNPFEIVAHRGIPTQFPENTLPAFFKAIELGADAVELDVRLTKDKVPIVFHYYYLNNVISFSGPIFKYTFDELSGANFLNAITDSPPLVIPTLYDVIEQIGGKIGLEIEIKGPEPESAIIIANILKKHQNIWPSIEVTSYEIALLQDFREQCPGIATDLLYPPSQPWMELDVVAYEAANKARMAGARAVHLHPHQLSEEVVRVVRSSGVEIHAWDVNDEQALETILEFNIPKVCTDRFELAARFREQISV